MAASPFLNIIPSVASMILIAISFFLCVVFYMRRKAYWEKRGVPCAKPNSWFLGNIRAREKVPPAYVFQRIYYELDGHKFGGFYHKTQPAVLLRDPELIRTVLIKDFSHFHDRTTAYCNEKVDPLSVHLDNLCGKRWKDVRSKLTPAFSSGKLRDMQNLMNGCVSELADYLHDVTSDNSTDSEIQDVRELMPKFATDVIGACVFGLDCHTVRDGDSEFRRIGRLAVVPSSSRSIHNWLRIINPKLIDVFNVKSIDPEVEKFFKSVLSDAVQCSQSNARRRNDFLQLLVNIQAEEKRKLQNLGYQQNGVKAQHQNERIKDSFGEQKDLLFTDNVVASNAFLFFFAGFSTVSLTLSFCLYELALNQDICEKLKDEVERVKQNNGGNLDYDAMKELVYMDAVLSETLRKYPNIVAITRRCTDSYRIPGTSVIIGKGTGVYIPVYSLHHDPKFFPEPEKFKPERFSAENKGSIVPGTYLPFGDGPRICIGLRFARYEMKACLSHIVSNYTLHSCEKTAKPLKFNPRSVFHVPLGGLWIRFQRRSKS